MKKLVLLVVACALCVSSQASVHAVSRSVKVASFPARHPKKSAKALGKAAAKSVKAAARLVF